MRPHVASATTTLASPHRLRQARHAPDWLDSLRRPQANSLERLPLALEVLRIGLVVRGQAGVGIEAAVVGLVGVIEEEAGGFG